MTYSGIAPKIDKDPLFDDIFAESKKRNQGKCLNR